MGLFDFVKCDWTLPVVDLSKAQITQEQIQTASYQTKDLDCRMGDYTIFNNGFVGVLRFQKTSYVVDEGHFLGGYVDEEGPYIDFVSVPEKFSMHCYFQTDGDADAYLEWSVTTDTKKIKEITAKMVNLIPNEQRKKLRQEMMETAQKQQIRQQKFYYKWLQRPILQGRYYLLTKAAKVFRRLSNWCIRFS